MADKPEYSELVAQAEKAVASVSDPELKRIAFQKVLDDLLQGGSARAHRDPPRPSTRKQKKARTARTGATTGPRAYISEMIEEGFFKKPKTISNVKAELENRGHHIPLTSLSGPLQKLCQKKKLRRQKLRTSDKKQAFAYSNW
ncbi:MAG: hypothetical protein M3N91_04480 [Pseudomonadota bacterium]|jgi:hypothetical protein|nr:hypothetical protein [Pseudomonadota bacterium]